MKDIKIKKQYASNRFDSVDNGDKKDGFFLFYNLFLPTELLDLLLEAIDLIPGNMAVTR